MERAEATLGQNLRYNEEEVKVGKRTVTKLWNASKLAIGHIQDYNFEEKDLENAQPADKWILAELKKTINKYHKSFQEYEYAKAKEAISKFFWDEFCGNYLEFVKYRLYAEKIDQKSQKAAYATLFKTLLAILKMFAPIMPFITEEIYQLYFREQENSKSIHITRMPEISKINEEDIKQFAPVLQFIEEIRKYKALKNYSIKKPLIKVTAGSELKIHEELLKAVLSIEQLQFSETSKLEIED
jgi:valyl-tRNA synthetase